MTEAPSPNEAAPAAPTSPEPARARPLYRLALPLLAVGVILTALALLSQSGRSRIGHGYLLGFAFVWTIVLGSLFFVALQHITRSVWSVTMRRVAEMFASPMLLLAAFFVPVVVFGVLHHSFGIFEWMDPEHVRGDAVLQGKAPYLNYRFWLLRAAVFFGLWVVFGAFFVRQSLKQDAGESDPSTSRRLRKWSGPFLILFAFTVTFASFDWIMSLDAHWYSTIYGVYVFSGMTLAGLAAITLGVIYFRKRGWIDPSLLTPDHLYSLGGLLFAFTCFWAYIAFSQFLLIWYANIPEETSWFVDRVENGWLAVTLLLAAVRFVVPFFLLLSRRAKKDPRTLVAASVLVLFGQLLDLYWLIMPGSPHAAPPLGLAEVGPALLLTGVFLFAWARFTARHRLVAAGDPLFDEARHFHL